MHNIMLRHRNNFRYYCYSYFVIIIIIATGAWRKLHNEELHNFYSSPNIIIAVKSRSMKCAELAPQMADKKKRTLWSESASELYRPSDRRLSVK
jgi:hypothetical protein